MLPGLRSRRRPRYGAHLCAAVAAVLLLLSVALLHTRLTLHHQPHPALPLNDVVLDSVPILHDTVSDFSSDDRIDELDIVEEAPDEGDDDGDGDDGDGDQPRVSSFYFDHVMGAIRRHFDKKSIDKWEDYSSFDAGIGGAEERIKGAFASDDVAVDEEVRRKVTQVRSVEDALLIKTGGRANTLREGWGVWFDKKSDFLRRDRMFKSNLELLNPLNNPMLQDPDAVGVTGLTRGDRLVQRLLMNEFKRVPFRVTHRPPVTIEKSGGVSVEKNKDFSSGLEGRMTEIKRAERRTLDDNASNSSHSKNSASANHTYNLSTYDENLSSTSKRREAIQGESIGSTIKAMDSVIGDLGKSGGLKNVVSKAENNVYADGKRWGYFPSLHPSLSFSNFMDAFFRKGRCDLRVFMVWNSPPWMYGVRHQRGLESLLLHHRDACVVVFSETMELDFFKDFVKDGFKIAVAMPNLDELLKDTPTHIFSSLWFEWQKTKFYFTHYSELVRLAALYKYGGIYLDTDIIVLKPLSWLNNSVGLEDQLTQGSINGAVMAFRKHSPFIMECLTEFYSTYDDTRLRWNGADLLTRVGGHFLNKMSISDQQLELKVQSSFVFFPIDRDNIARYFASPATEIERAGQDVLFRKILLESFTFHFWNSLTSAIVPEPDSLVGRLINHQCIRCIDVL